MTDTPFRKISGVCWEIPKSFRSDMRVPGRIYATDAMLREISNDRSIDQLVNVASLPGIQDYAIAMPDIHEGYGFPIGGVAATKYPDGVISPGGIGYDINCGVRLLTSNLTNDQIQPVQEQLAKELYKAIPSGFGKRGNFRLKETEFDGVLTNGALWAIDKGYGPAEDTEHIESGGRIPDADPEAISDHAKSRGMDQLGTIGSGNHFVEVDVVEKIFDEATAKTFGLSPNQIVVLIHTGSRGLGHQVATEYIRVMMEAMERYDITVPDRELACAPFSSKEGQQYFHAMAGAANFAFANRQMITWEVRAVWDRILHEKLAILYDVAHNIAKVEEYETKVIVHRKGATRAFPGQPVLIPGSMGTASYVLVGQEGAMKQTFGSTCHGAGRRLSRHEAGRVVNATELRQQLLNQGIIVEAGSLRGISEEAPIAYKDIDRVVDVVDRAGIAKKVARLKPVIVIKG